MVQAIVNLGEYEDRVVSLVKAKYGLANKSEAVNKIIQECAEEHLEVRPEYLRKLKKISKGPHKHFKTPEELRKYLEKA